jgi:phosphoribosyl-AMP cyclohydrolase
MQIAILSFFYYFTPMFKKRESIFEVEEGKFLAPKFDKDGLMPVTTTDSNSGEVLMQSYVNEEALKKQ